MNYDDPKLKAYFQHAEQELLPKVKQSALSITLVSGRVDPKLCLELGACILLDKPIIAVLTPGAAVPANLKRVASCILEGEMSDPSFQDRLQAALTSVLANDARVPKPSRDEAK